MSDNSEQDNTSTMANFDETSGQSKIEDDCSQEAVDGDSS